ncbi:energy transducer TonB [Desulfuromonas acetexigens]|uniref:Energy transducer TonB n=1 Tax=Trichloromonas acetexigens TaxID=38815 RepID=A0A550J8E0_9BACT|nr:energy transducer TonB [Desulfuromonas acetexigens]
MSRFFRRRHHIVRGKGLRLRDLTAEGPFGYITLQPLTIVPGYSVKHSPLLAALTLSLGIHAVIVLFPEEVGDVRPAPEKTTEVGLVYIAPPTTSPPQPAPAASAAPLKPTPPPTPPEPKAPPKKRPLPEKPRRTAAKNIPPQQAAAEVPPLPQEPVLPSATLTDLPVSTEAPVTESVPADGPPPTAQTQPLPQSTGTPPVAPAPLFKKTIQPPRYRFTPKPEYPGLANQRRWQGEVLLRALVDDQGAVTRVEVESSSGHDILDQAALKTVRRWKFDPAHDGEKNVSHEVFLPVRFELPRR